MNKEDFLSIDEYPLQILFYPISFSGDKINGIGVGDDTPSQSNIVSIADFYLLKFFTPEIFFFQMKFKEPDFFEKNKNDGCEIFAFINNRFENYSDSDSERYHEYIDKYTGNPNILKHIITKSKKVSDRQKKCIFLAIDYGFPLIDLVNCLQDDKRELMNKILEEWEDIIGSQHGSKENDFIRTLKRGTRTIKEEYSDLFTEINKIFKENSFLAAKPLFSFVNVFPELGSLPHIIPPKIFFDRALIKAIFDLKNELATKYSEELSVVFKDRGYNANIRYSIIAKSRKKDKYRVKYTLNLGFPKYMELSSIKSGLNEVKYLILSKLKEIDSDAYESFCRSRLEIWLKRIRIHVIIYSNFEKEAINLIKENFAGVLNSKSLISQKISKDLSKISLRLSFDMITDYSISEIEPIDSIPDKYTRLAVEKLYRREFMQALEYLKMGKNGLLGDLNTIKSKEVNLEPGLSKELSEKAAQYYVNAKIDNSNFPNGYFDNRYKDRVLRALEINSDWIVSLKLFMEAKRLGKETISKESLKKEDLEKKMHWEIMYKKYSGLNIDKNLNNFIEEMGNFYFILLENIQRRYGIPPHEILGFGF